MVILIFLTFREMIFYIIEIINTGIKLFILKNLTEVYKIIYILGSCLVNLYGSIIVLCVPLSSTLIGISRCALLVPVKRVAQEFYFE